MTAENDAYDVCMRTTVTLDDDVAEALKNASREHGVSFKDVLNMAIRRGLARGRSTQEPYSLPTFALGVRPGVDLDKASHLAADMEDDAIAAKLELRK